MKSKLIFCLIAVCPAIAAFAADEPEKTGVIHLDHEKVAAAFAKGGGILATNNFKVQAGEA